ncbi:MAG: ABC transporter ATP-binding protein [Eubacteriales bacterium]
MTVILEMKGVSKYFTRDGKIFEVLKNVNLEVLKGEILCLLGPSGCGKSTLLRQLAGFDERDGGSLFMYGKNITKPEVNRIMIFQEFNQLFPWKTVLENIMYPLKVNNIGQSKGERKDIASNYLTMVGLNEFANSYPYQLSGGMKQKAAIARALALKSEVLLMDEPFGSLDALTRGSLQNMLLKIWEETKVSIVFVTHDIQEAIILSDRMAIFGRNHGEIRGIIDNPLERPRNNGKQAFSEIYQKAYSLLELSAER